jgi:hypothetical protein
MADRTAVVLRGGTGGLIAHGGCTVCWALLHCAIPVRVRA